MTNLNLITRRLSAGFAALTGRTRLIGGWGCNLTSKPSIKVALALAISPTAASAFDVPSGEVLTFQESFYEEQLDGSLWARFRFVMPSIARGGQVGYADVAEDFLHLCDVYVLPGLGDDVPEQIVISLSDRETEFGVPAPEATQFFEAFRVESGSCIWEGF